MKLAGLAGEVEIFRDAHGVPHIFAGSANDAYFALGYVHAQDRLWQMEFTRRLGAGRLAEVLGEPGLGADRFLRTLGLYRQAEVAAARLSPTALGAWMPTPRRQCLAGPGRGFAAAGIPAA